jgi:hypothetical protein
MNKYAAVLAIAMFALGAVAGHSMTAATPAAMANAAPASAFELMRNAPAMLPDQTSREAV